MRTPDAGTTLGKCTFCKDFIVEGNGMKAKHATVRGGHWMCGLCIMGLKNVVFQAFMDFQSESEKEKEELMAELKQYGWSVNPDTGKLEKL
jgi:hypothetical protein